MADVTLPQLGETVTEGTITRWFKKVGDSVSADEPLFEVSTDKVDTEVPSPIAGTVTEIRVQEGDTVPVGAVIAVVGEAAAAPAEASAPAAPAQEEVSESPVDDAAQPPPTPVVQDEPPAKPAAAEAPPAEVPPPPAASPAPVAPEPQQAPADAADTSDTPSDSRLLSPVVRRLVAEHNIKVDQVKGTGPGGRITRDDVLDYIDKAATQAPQPAASAAPVPASAPAPAAAKAPGAPAAAPAAVTPGERDSTVRLSKIRKLTGSHMVMSKGVSPHAFSVVEVDFANVDLARNQVKAEWKDAEGFGLTYLPFITRAVVEALADFPHLNASVSDEDLIVHNFIDIGIAVDLDYEGLLVPVIRAAETKRLRAIAREINDLARRARSRKLGPDEISGGTFTISNNGSAGSVLTMPIINQPQVAILSTDAIVRKPVVVHTSDGGEGSAIHPVGNLAMSWDHRAFDGAYAAGFLVKMKQTLETRDWSAEL
jgi:2-oxoglutarate dehydrogenase E2 component (dihydrolipoamide succinyltransferase)